jgi:hypothetical protein
MRDLSANELQAVAGGAFKVGTGNQCHPVECRPAPRCGGGTLKRLVSTRGCGGSTNPYQPIAAN